MKKLNSFEKLIQPFESPYWASSGHSQTLAGFLLPSKSPPQRGQQVLVDLPDGDQLVCYENNLGSEEVYIFFHGLGGCVRSNYMRRASALCQNMGISSVLVNHRGAGEGVGKASKIYHSGRSDDASFVIQYFRERFGQTKKIFAVGFSLSANILLLLNGRDHQFAQADGYISVNGPIHLSNCSLLLQQGLNKIYDQYFLKILKPMLPLELRKTAEIKSLWDFDGLWTAPQAGFSSREEYYRKCSAQTYLNKLHKPHIILMSEDDPFVSFQDYRDSEYSDKAVKYFAPSGGHLGYLTRSKTSLQTRRWLDYFLMKGIEFFRSES